MNDTTYIITHKIIGQSFAFFYHIWKSGQQGNVTRIVSGCSDEQATLLRRKFKKQIIQTIPDSAERFHLHFTPDYSKIHYNYSLENINITTDNEKPKQYTFFNKPYGLKNWMETKLGFSHDPNSTDSSLMDNTIIIILDPDQFVIRPFQVDYTNDNVTKWVGKGKSWFLGNEQPLQVTKGLPFGQMYAYFHYWFDAVNDEIDKVINAIEWHDEAFNAVNGLLTWTTEDVDRYYIAGPPYIGVASDMYDITTVWSKIVVPIYHLARKDHLSEMFAYSTAAAYLKLRHQLSYSFMYSNADLPHYEHWNDKKYDNVEPTLPNANSDNYFLEWSNPSYDSSSQYYTTLPHVFHFCQEYMIGPYYFFKYYIPGSLLSCVHPMLLEPPSLLVQDPSSGLIVSTNASRSDCGMIAFQYNSSYSPSSEKIVYHQTLRAQKRHAFAVCQMIYKLNDAIEFWKHANCNTNPNTTYDRTFVLPDHKKYALLTT